MFVYVKEHNCCHWAPSNPHEHYQRLLHSAKVTVCCAVYCYGIIGPYFCENEEGRTLTVHEERHKVMLETFLSIELHPREQDLLRFQQDGAEISMQVLRTMFPDTLATRIGDITCPARSPDLVVPDYFLWSNVRSKVYETRPANIADLKQRILDCIQGIPKSMLQRVMTAFPSQLQVCIERHGSHYQVSHSNNND